MTSKPDVEQRHLNTETPPLLKIPNMNRTGVSGDFILWERWSHVVSNEQEVPARVA